MHAYQPKNLDPGQIEGKPIAYDITVVIPTLGRPILEESLYWLVSGGMWPRSVIVVDQSSSQAVAALMEKVSRLGIDGRHIPSSQRGRARGINRGLERVETPYVAITDDDCFVEAEWLEKMVAHLRLHPGGIVTGRVEAAGEDMIVVVQSKKPAIYYRPRIKFDSMSGGNMGTSMSVFERVGFFDEHESLATSEDGEWSYRALRGGAFIVYAPEAGVRHYGWRDENHRGDQYRDYARSHGGFYGKYLRKGDMFIALRAILHFGRAMRRWVLGTISGDLEAARFGRAYVLGLLPGILAGIRRK